ncbi:MAG: sulfite exporter TauE/SafE family protein [Candidatus Helarchaeota archaeon]
MDLADFFLLLSLGLAAAILGALMGVGGGFLMVPSFIYLGFTKDYAPVLSLFVIIFVASSATIRYAHERTINYRLGLIYAPFSIAGAFMGAYLLHVISNLVFKVIFSGLIIVVGGRLILKKDQSDAKSPEKESRWSYYWVIIWGFLTGMAASFVGIGGGLIAVPVIHLFFMETIHVAIATSLFIMIFTSSFATLQHFLLGYMNLILLLTGLVVAIGAIIGSQIGSKIQIRLKGKTLQRIFGGFMIGIAIPLLWLGA